MTTLPPTAKLIEVLEILEIKKATIYPWIKATGIIAHKDPKTRMIYFDESQIKILLDFQAHLKNGGLMRDWKVEETESIEVEAVEELEQFEAMEGLEETDEVEAVEAESGEIVPIAVEEIHLNELPPAETNRHAELISNAQRQAAGVIIAQNLLASQYIDRPETLPPEMQKIINDSAPIPKLIDPLQYAKTLMMSHSQGQHQAA